MPRNEKENAFLSPHCVSRPIATQPPRVSSSTLYCQTPWATFFPLIVCVYLLSNFRSGLRKTHDRAVRFDPSRSSEVNDFRVIWKGLCDFLLVINSNLSSISHRFWDMTTYRFKTANFPYPTSVQAQIWKCSLCTRSLKFCIRRAKTLG